ncbi:recombinase family protein [Gordonia terrae]|uniref:Resolvase n=2 Tax=Gordonia terrae TaxID=2055 RepID=A0AAD0KEZ6_9ACTN|nr:recombinase family protein [Gordonia terrae]VTR08092.1 resolvase domain-containing protein [Clostridioides difficile]ANY25219.1 resolvase [Gordonia terrae]AWO85967.1 resolvase [Gordonia terrae]VTS62239.1 Transposon Tn3 resolvase [Gordonia terrae]GAB45562.1 putative resolvase [Gordonia terrae NBRC 100016]
MTKSKSTSRAEALRRALADKSQPAEPEVAEYQPLKCSGYVRVSTTVQDTKGYGLRSQQDYLTKYCLDRGHQLLTVTSDVVSGGKAAEMHGRAVAINALEAGMADALLVRALDRATRDQLDAAELYKRAELHGWRLLDCEGADSGEPSQRLTADIRLAVAAEERRRISVRTREGLARAKREGKKLGRPSRIDPLVVKEIVSMRREEGLGPKAIANWLDEAGIATPGGGYRWHYATVRRVLSREGVA